MQFGYSWFSKIWRTGILDRKVWYWPHRRLGPWSSMGSFLAVCEWGTLLKYFIVLNGITYTQKNALNFVWTSTLFKDSKMEKVRLFITFYHLTNH